MLRYVADENFHYGIVLGLRRRMPALDVVTVQEVGLSGVIDPRILQWAADEDRILLTHDFDTIIEFAHDRVRRGLPMPGVFEVSQDASFARLIEDLMLLAECSLDDEWQGRVKFVPF